MAEAIISGMLKSGTLPDDISILDVNDDRIEYMKSRYRVDAPSAAEFFKKAEVIVIAVKPQVIEKVLTVYQEMIVDANLIISIAAGISIDKIERLSGNEKVIRVMPNTPALISMGMSAISSRSSKITAEDRQTAEHILGSIGEFIWVDEAQMDAVTAISGSGPAYVYRFADSLIDSGVLVGLTRDIARKLVIETMLGSTMMLKTTGRSPKELESQVTSPGGTTIHGLAALEKNNFSSSVKEGVKAAYKRSIELGNENK